MNAGYKTVVRSKFFVALLAMMMVFGSVVSPLSGAFVVYADDEDAAADAVSAVYVGGKVEGDERDGSSPEKAVATWDEAVEILGDNDGIIYVCGTLSVSGTISLPGASQEVRRAEGFDGLMFDVEESATFKNITVNGEGRSAADAAIQVYGDESLEILPGAVFKGLRNMENGYGGVIRMGYKYPIGSNIDHVGADGATLLIDGGEFYDNEAAFEGGVILASGTTTITIRSGKFIGNKAMFASVCANYTGVKNEDGPRNTIEVFNALITENTSMVGAYEINDAQQEFLDKGKGDDKTGTSAGGLNICHEKYAQLHIYETDGAAIYNNNRDDNGNIIEKGDIGVWDASNIDKIDANEYMLGGGEYNWTAVGDKGMAANPDETGIDNAKMAAVTIIKENISHYQGTIQSNDMVNIGRDAAEIEFKKIDSTSKEALEGVEFELTGENVAGNPVRKVATTSEEGMLSLGSIAPGTYTLKETTAPDGYKLVQEGWSVEVGRDNSITVRDADGNVIELDEETGSYYTIENDRILINISKQDLGGNELSGAEMKITGPDGFEETWTSDSEEPHKLWLKAGEYELVEVVAPEGYNNATVTTTIKFTVEADGTVKVTGATEEYEGVELDNGCKFEVLEPDHLVLKDSPIAPKEEEPKEEPKEEEETGFFTPVEEKETPEVRGAYESEVKNEEANEVKSEVKSVTNVKSVETGDESVLGIWLMMLMISMCAITFATLIRLRAHR